MERLFIELKKHIIDNKLRVKVRPGAKTTEIAGFENDFLVIRIHAPPAKGKANDELARFFRKQFNKKIRIIKGEKSREKIIEL
jgi:hypothetical protein